MTDFTDYHHYTWKETIAVDGYWRSTFKRLPLLIPVTVGLLYLANKIDLTQKQIFYGELFTLMSLYILTFMITINTIWYQIIKSRGSKLVSYHISKAGIRIDKSTTPFSHLDLDTVTKELTSTATLSTPSHNRIKLKLKKQHGSLTLIFENEQTYQRALSALNHYLANQTLTTHPSSTLNQQ